MQSNNECIDCKECKACHCPSDLKHNNLFCEQVKSLWHKTCSFCQSQNETMESIKCDCGRVIFLNTVKQKKQYGNEEIQKMFEKLIPKLQGAGIHGFSDSQKWARIYVKHLVNLQKKLGEEEFDRRVDVLLSNSFHRQNCNKIKYLYNNINGFVEPKSNISTLVL